MNGIDVMLGKEVKVLFSLLKDFFAICNVTQEICLDEWLLQGKEAHLNSIESQGNKSLCAMIDFQISIKRGLRWKG